MADEVVAWLAPRPGGIYCDATLGAGGHAERVLAASAPSGRLIGIDRDSETLERTRERLSPFGVRVTLVHGTFGDTSAILDDLQARPCDGLLCDLGLSSMHLDTPDRGFSFRQEGPLDMRMDRTSGETALDLLHRVRGEELEAILRDYGEERYAGRIARSIKDALRRGELQTTRDLAELVAAAVPTRERRLDPATRTFQALRIAVNRELEELDQLLDELPSLLSRGGRVVFLSFHSLEDRRVKRRLRELSPRTGPDFRRLTPKPVRPTAAEVARNPRARSARLRAAERCHPDGEA